MRKTGFGRFVIKWLPAGIATAPFEFAFFIAYALAAGKYLLDTLLYGHGRDAAALAALPLKGAELTGWLIVLLVGSLFVCSGLVLTGKHPFVGLSLERAGLIGGGTAIGVYLVQIISSQHGFSFSIGLFTVVVELLAVLYRTLLVGQVLDRITRKARTRP